MFVIKSYPAKAIFSTYLLLLIYLLQAGYKAAFISGFLLDQPSAHSPPVYLLLLCLQLLCVYSVVSGLDAVAEEIVSLTL